MFFTIAKPESRIEAAVDEYGDSFARDVTVDELKEVHNSSATFKIVKNSRGFRLSSRCLRMSNTASMLIV